MPSRPAQRPSSRTAGFEFAEPATTRRRGLEVRYGKPRHQLAVAPVFLLTAIATLISALNIRLGRIVDRQRAVLQDAHDGAGSARSRSAELVLLSRRVHLAYLAILSAVMAGLFVCLVVAAAFVGVLLEADLAKLLAALFILAMMLLIASLSLFLREIYIAVSGRARIVVDDAAPANPQPSS
jgi:hypothetical protein